MSNEPTDLMERTLRDGVVVVYCWPHRRWEWDCRTCGHANSSRATFCGDCGNDRSDGVLSAT